MSDLLCNHIVSHLVGVIDIQGGAAVHAVAGQRDRYQPVPFCCGDAVKLARHYQRLGVSRLYVADLDSIRGDALQTDLLHSLIEISRSEILIDVGWKQANDRSLADAVGRLDAGFPHSRWIAATESMSDISSLDELATLVPAERIILGLDYCSGSLNSANAGIGEEQWIEAAGALGSRAALALDLAAVGTAQGPRVELVERISRATAGWTLYSGGGVRSARDVQRLVDAGCRGCLIATALHNSAG